MLKLTLQSPWSMITLMILLFLAKANSIRAAVDTLDEVGMGSVEVEGDMGRRIDGLLNENILQLDIDKDFLLSFATGEQQIKPYIGIGKMILALVHYQQYTHNDPQVVALKEHILDTLRGVQKANGYIGFFGDVPVDERMCKLWSTHELAYIVQGFAVDYLAFNNEESLETARRAADFLVDNWTKRTCTGSEWHRTNFIGLATAILRVYQATGEQKYLEFVVDTLEVPQWHPDFVNRDYSQHNHVYTHLSHCLEHLYLYRILQDPDLLRTTDAVVDFITHGDGMLVTGGVAQMELWHNTQECCGNSTETCAVAYLLRLLHERTLIGPLPLYGDIMERSMHNALKATHSPDCRHIRYHTPAEGPRKYFGLDYYCCPCNLRRIMPEISTMIYYPFQQKPGLIVHQYMPSRATFTLADGTNLKVKQVTEYPYSDSSEIYLDPDKPATFAVQLRIPAWCRNTESNIFVNDQSVANVTGSNYYLIERHWQKGDVIRLELPLDWRIIKGRKMQSGTCAILRGPLVYGLNPAHNPDMKKISPQLYHRIMLDPDTLAVAEPVIIDGVTYHACTVKGWWPGSIQHRSLDLVLKPAEANIELILTEFADPGCVRTYFRMKPGVCGKDDELIR